MVAGRQRRGFRSDPSTTAHIWPVYYPPGERDWASASDECLAAKEDGMSVVTQERGSEPQFDRRGRPGMLSGMPRVGGVRHTWVLDPLGSVARKVNRPRAHTAHATRRPCDQRVSLHPCRRADAPIMVGASLISRRKYALVELTTASGSLGHAYVLACDLPVAEIVQELATEYLVGRDAGRVVQAYYSLHRATRCRGPDRARGQGDRAARHRSLGCQSSPPGPAPVAPSWRWEPDQRCDDRRRLPRRCPGASATSWNRSWRTHGRVSGCSRSRGPRCRPNGRVVGGLGACFAAAFEASRGLRLGL